MPFLLNIYFKTFVHLVCLYLKDKNLLGKLSKVSKIVNVVGKLMTALSAAGVIAEILFTFLMPSELDVMQKEFKEATMTFNVSF